MKLAKNAFIIALTMLSLVFTMSAQTPRPDDDARNQAPTVGTGGPPGGPTGLFTIYDGSTLRAGEFTFSAAWSNYDRDPGDVDINEVPVSFQVGVNDYVELFFNTDAYRGVKVNAPRNLSSFYLPNSQVLQNGVLIQPPALVLGSGAFAGQPVFLNNRFFTPFPFVGGRTSVPFANSLLGAPVASAGNGADNFPGIGSVYGSILPGIVLQTVNVGIPGQPVIVPTSFSTAPSYLNDAPFINRRYGESSFSTFTVGAKIRFTGPNNPYGIGLIPFYRFYADDANSRSGFNQMQRGSSPGSKRGDFGLVLFGDARLNKFVNVSANLGYIYNSDVKAEFPSGDFTILDRGDEVLAGIGVDFPINKYFQPIIEFRSTQYVGGRTPNAFENSPLDAIGGVRFFPTRYISLGAAYRYHVNQQNEDSFDGASFTSRAVVTGPGGGTFTTTGTGIPRGFTTSNDPHGFIFQFTAGRRNLRKKEETNKPADVTNLDVSEAQVTGKCGPGERPKSGSPCSDDQSINVTTTAVDPENDVLTYQYTVSGGRIVGQGANVSWDLTNAQTGTYTITAGVDDGCGVCGKTQTKTITVAKCECEVVCACPTLDVTGTVGSVAPGETVTFTANVSGGSQSNPTYNWSVSSGTIIEGQGTPVIRVQTTRDMAGQSVTGSVNIGGVCDECPRDGSATVNIDTEAPPLVSTQVDEFGKLSNDDVKARIENFYITQLNNNPSAQGYIINYGTAKQIAAREKQIRDAIRFLRFEESRVTMVRGGATGGDVRTVLWVVPAGATPPTPDQ